LGHTHDVLCPFWGKGATPLREREEFALPPLSPRWNTARRFGGTQHVLLVEPETLSENLNAEAGLRRDVHLEIVVARVLADDHAFIHFGRRCGEEHSPDLQRSQRVLRRLPI
jgi:hypothetical protein